MDTRDVALTVLLDIETNQTFSNIALGNALRKNQFTDKVERAFLSRLVEGVTETKLRLDYVIDQYSKTKIKKCKPVIACLLRMGCYQILFVNGVLRTITREKTKLAYPDQKREPERYLSVMTSTPLWLVQKLILEYGTESAETIFQAAFADRKTSIRLNKHRIEENGETMDSYKNRLKEAGITVEPGAYYEGAWLLSGYDFIHKIPGYKQGYFTVQDESSMCAVAAAGIRPEDFVMDICAVPGGKTTAAAEFAQQGHVLSMDIAEEKLELIEENVERLKLANVDIRCQDATEYMQEQEEKADVVIADLPCSGLGIMGRKNDIKYRVTEEQIESLVELQHTILQNACRYVKAGGTLLYSTCTITKEENTLQVERFLKEHPEYTLKEQRQFLQGIDACDGFYYAVLHKLGD